MSSTRSLVPSALRDVLAEFGGGHVVVGVTSTPFKCPPAPSETALLMHDLLRDKGLLDSSHVSLVMPLGVPIPPSPAASEVILAAFAERDISWHPGQARARTRSRAQGRSLRRRGRAGVRPVPRRARPPGTRGRRRLRADRRRLGARRPTDAGDVFPGGVRRRRRRERRHTKAGVFAEGQARWSPLRSRRSCAEHVRGRTYDGHGLCYLDLGQAGVAKVDVTFSPGAGALRQPDRPVQRAGARTRPSSGPAVSSAGSEPRTKPARANGWAPCRGLA